MFSPFEIVIAIVVSAIGAALKDVVGFGFGVLSVPILTILNPDFTPIPQLILALPLTATIALRDRPPPRSQRRRLGHCRAGWRDWVWR